ncbi:hypothetical protein DNTS_024845 [Danionella cerebrum]|uniref:Uncharacterized protein n=1 Tax=Danionella cerebrum TaxID=2873325 RepID=A0A553QSN7_9TELE|nr:hypothetical protein DNTS_024845 [Danionella translucida]
MRMDYVPHGNADSTAVMEQRKDNGNETEVCKSNGSWEPSVLSTIGKETLYFAGHKICIWESLDSFGSVIWPAALSLCRYLESSGSVLDLFDKAVLELGAGTGLVSIATCLLGAWVTATDLSPVLGNLRCNLSRNTRGRCRYTPQVAELSWSWDLDASFPRSVYHYDYVLAADVVYHHEYLPQLLETMKHFCQDGTTLIWANKTRFQSDHEFEERFNSTFSTQLLEDDGEVKIYAATRKEEGIPFEEDVESWDYETEDEDKDEERASVRDCECPDERNEENSLNVDDKVDINEENGDLSFEMRMENVGEGRIFGEEMKYGELKTDTKMRDDAELIASEETKNQDEFNNKMVKGVMESVEALQECDTAVEDGEDISESGDGNQEDSDAEKDEDQASDCDEQTPEKGIEKDKQQESRKSWVPMVYSRPDRELFSFMGQKISIEESFDSYGATVWPASPALCQFLESPRGRSVIDLKDKTVLELGAGTGLLSVVITLLGARLTVTDLPEILGNLTYNLNRNTRGLRRHEPCIKQLFWGQNLEENFPQNTFKYDYVLATDVVYHHDFLRELMITMIHFCQPMTTIIWANKVRYASDLGFIDDFFSYFDAKLLEEIDDVRIYMGQCKRGGRQDAITG